MKKGWEWKRIDEVCDFVSGLWKGEKPPLVRVGVIRNTNFTREGTLDRTDIAQIEVEQKKLEKRRLRYGDIILEKSGGGPKQPVGRVALFEIADGEFSFSNFTSALRVRDTGNVDFRYVHKCLYWLYQSGVTESMQTNSTGIRNLNADAYKSLTIPIPPLPEQQRIVGILDEAFAGLATAEANAARNLQNAREIFDSHLHAVFSQRGESWVMTKLRSKGGLDVNSSGVNLGFTNDIIDNLNAGRATRTGGRNATLRHIPGPLSLSVGAPLSAPKSGWRWVALNDLARLESGHTPSRQNPGYWGGDIPWMGIQDARNHHGKTIFETAQATNPLGIANSSARVLPAQTVCLSRTASVGYVVIMGRPMATSQDFINWICGPDLLPAFLKYILLAEGREGLLRYASGSVHQTIYFPEAKGFWVCIPRLSEQQRIVDVFDALFAEIVVLETSYHSRIRLLSELKKSLLHGAFNGEL